MTRRAATCGRLPSSGGAPMRLTKEAGDYVDPVWSQDGHSVIVARGEGATATTAHADA